jgi:hypothetical protein
MIAAIYARKSSCGVRCENRGVQPPQSKRAPGSILVPRPVGELGAPEFPSSTKTAVSLTVQPLRCAYLRRVIALAHDGLLLIRQVRFTLKRIAMRLNVAPLGNSNPCGQCCRCPLSAAKTATAESGIT